MLFYIYITVSVFIALDLSEEFINNSAVIARYRNDEDFPVLKFIGRIISFLIFLLIWPVVIGIGLCKLLRNFFKN